MHFKQISVLIVLIFTCFSCEVLDDSKRDFPLARDVISPVDSNALHFFVLSDWGFSGAYDQSSVALGMSQISRYISIQFILTCGDNFQIAGVTSTNDPLWQSNFESIYNDSALHVPWYPALGNHDYLGNPDAQVEYSALSKYWTMPARYYTFVKQVDSAVSARFIVLDTQSLISSYQSLTDITKYDTIAQYTWLRTLLSEAPEKWIFVTGHHPVYSASDFHGDTEELKRMIKPLFDEFNVDFYICGHDHHFEHTKDADKSTDYIVTGTGGAPRPAWYNSMTIYAMSAPGFTYISLSPNKTKLYFITSAGRVGYGFEKEK